VKEREERIVDEQVKRKTRGGSERIHFEGEKHNLERLPGYTLSSL
jgi:hypothetical protein